MLSKIVLGLLLIFLDTSVLATPAISPHSSLEEAVVRRVSAGLPVGWSIVDKKAEVIPEGHYWGESYTGIRGFGVQLQGPRNVNARWQDGRKVWHEEPVGKEALWLYVMPSTYAESQKRHLLPNRPNPAVQIFEDSGYKLYAYPMGRIVQTDRMDVILKQNISIEWPDSPRTTGVLSWENWREEIKNSLSVR
jgi:hypothetical protein